MFLSRIFPGKWKHHRWKRYWRKYTPHHDGHSIKYSDIVSKNIDITEHVKHGRVDAARKLFDEMPARTVVTWNAMISGYSKWGKYNESLRLVSSMHLSGTIFTATTFSTALSACANSQALVDGKQIHGLVLKCGTERFEFVGSALLYFYANCFEIDKAKSVFDELSGRNKLLWSVMLVGYVRCNFMSDALDVLVKMPVRDVVAWTTLISGYSKSENGCEKALDLFWWMRESCEVSPNEFTFDAVLRACARIGALCKGRAVHGILLKYGFESDPSIGGALIEFYCECEVVDDAKRVYGEIVNPCLNASNLLLSGLIDKGRIEEAELIFSELTELNPVSYNLMIKGYELCGRVADSIRLFEKMPCRTIISSNTMISLYARNGEIDKALMLFEETKKERNPVTWNSMISGYVQNECPEEAFRLYITMHRLSVEQTRSTFSVLFQACSCFGSILQGRLFHSHLVKTPFESNVYVGTSLIDMYSKCGSISDAKKSFMSISPPNVAAWTALLSAYAHHGLGSEALLLFENMIEKSVAPNAATFVAVLSGCCHAGCVSEGLRLFHSMEKQYGITPSLEHYACVVDLLSRSGHLQQAEKFIDEMPIEADGVIWGALLHACWFCRNMKVGERVAEKMLGIDPKPVSAFVILSNMYAVAGNWDLKIAARERLKGLNVKKDAGRSWIELNREVHVFLADDRNHPCSNLIFMTLESLTANLKSLFHFESNHELINDVFHEYSAR